MAKAILITECLQRDFVDPIGPYDPIPNDLHVGHTESIRLMGDDPTIGPLAQLMNFAESLDEDEIAVVHVRDWHDADDPHQADHLTMFGHHCLRDTRGAELVLELDHAAARLPNQYVVDSLTLNDFEGTALEALIRQLGGATLHDLRIGVVGVWTDAKVSYLLYELKTRLGIDRLATCSALTASASRDRHFTALEQLHRILGVTVFDSVAEFADWLRPGAELEVPPPHGGIEPAIDIVGVIGADVLDGADRAIVGHLFRESSAVHLAPMSGGYSGSSVFGATSEDTLGHHQAPSVVKIGHNKEIAQERAAFERVEEILGNNAPSVRGFVDLGKKAGLKYSYAAMGQSGVRTLKSLFEQTSPIELIEIVIRMALEEVLGPLYAAARYERLPIFSEYSFSAEWGPSVRANVAEIADRITFDPDGARLSLPGGIEVPNVVSFYETFLATEHLPASDSHYVSYVHGDLNMANVLIDGHDNVWVIDFFHTAQGHVLKDLAKLENDLLYIVTPLKDADDLRRAMRVTEALLEVSDLAAPLPATPPQGSSPALERAWRILRLLREAGASLCREDRNPLQLEIALLRYAVHTLGFDESSPLQKCWALGAAGLLAERVERRVHEDRRLRVDWIDDLFTTPGRLGITICPGRRDRDRTLADDLETLRDLGVRRLICLLPEDELAWAGVPDLVERATEAGLMVRHLPVPDQQIPGLANASDLVAWCDEGTAAGEAVVVCCMGGLGRSGTIAACYLVAHGLDAAKAISVVRRARNPRAVENTAQEAFLAAYAGHLPG